MELKTITKNVMYGILTMLAVMVAVSCVLGFLIWNENVAEATLPIVSNCAIAVIAFTVLMQTANKMPKSKLPVLLAVVLLNLIIGMLASAAMQGAEQSEIGVQAAIPAAAAVLAGLLSSRKRSKRRK